VWRVNSKSREVPRPIRQLGADRHLKLALSAAPLEIEDEIRHERAIREHRPRRETLEPCLKIRSTANEADQLVLEIRRPLERGKPLDVAPLAVIAPGEELTRHRSCVRDRRRNGR